jgi:acyl-homoserine-lactone acylase
VRMSRLALPLLALALSATLLPATAGAAPADRYDATIRRTGHGIPHIVGDDYGDLGFGFGYAHAEDNICTLADIYVTVNGERSRWFGPDGTWSFNGNGTTNDNLDSDFFYTSVNESGFIEDLLDQPPPHGPSAGIRDAVRGYVAGYNRYLDSVGGPDGIDDPRCAGQDWVRPITEMDAYRRFFQLASLASAGVAVGEIGSAQPPPPGGAGSSEETAVTAEQRDLIDEFPARFHEAIGIGSNAYGIGAEGSSNGRGLVLGNPHFPWHGGERLYQHHLTIPGVLDVSGASLYGVPVVLIGHTDGLAWSHTVSTAFRFTPFELTINQAVPTQYLVDGEWVDMQARDVEVEVRGEDGEVTTETRTLYETEYGPMMTGILGLPIFPWTPTKAWAMGDANRHLRYLNHFFEKNHAQSVRELKQILERNQGVPWVNTIAADASGEAYYADISVVPNVPDEHAQACNTALGIATFEALRLPVLDGARSDCGWLSDDDAVADGIFGPGNLPDLFRDDYVANGNDSYWLSNPEEPLEGYDLIIGDAGTARTLRTRLGIRMIQQRLAGEDEYAGDRFDQDTLADVVFNNRQHAGELVRDEAVAMCRSIGPVAPASSGLPAPVGDACDVLEGWDLRDDLDSNGAILFRRFWSHASGALPSPWADSFDPEDPVNTPRVLNTEHPQVRAALGDAINDLNGAGIPLDAPLRGWQYEDRGDGERIPIHGGPGVLGVFNAINVSWDGDASDGEAGYPDVDHGSSFVMSVQFTDDCPDTGAIVTYSQSEDVTSRWFKDQTRMYSEKRWNPMHFCEDDILSDPDLEVTRVRSAVQERGGSDDDRGAGGREGSGQRGGAAGDDGPLPATGGGALALVGLALLAGGARLLR